MTKVGGVGRHVDYLEKMDPIKLEGWAKCLLAFEMVYFISMALPKMAIVFLYLRVFNWRGAMRTWAWIIQGLLAATSLSFVLVACFQCRPLAYWWDRKIPGGVCINVQLFFHAQAIPGIIMDCFIMGLPLSTIWGLQLPVAKRVALALIFAIGSFGIVSSIIRATTFFSTSAFADRTCKFLMSSPFMHMGKPFANHSHSRIRGPGRLVRHRDGHLHHHQLPGQSEALTELLLAGLAETPRPQHRALGHQVRVLERDLESRRYWH